MTGFTLLACFPGPRCKFNVNTITLLQLPRKLMERILAYMELEENGRLEKTNDIGRATTILPHAFHMIYICDVSLNTAPIQNPKPLNLVLISLVEQTGPVPVPGVEIVFPAHIVVADNGGAIPHCVRAFDVLPTHPMCTLHN